MKIPCFVFYVCAGIAMVGCTNKDEIDSFDQQISPVSGSESVSPLSTDKTKTTSHGHGVVEQTFSGLSFKRMVHLTHASDGTNRLFLVLQPGQIMVFENQQGSEHPTIFLDIRGIVNDEGNEEGLLGLAFDPLYSQNGYFYVYYSTHEPRRSILSRFAVNPKNPNKVDLDSEKVIMALNQPFANHNGGHLAFGPDGYLYIGLGDGGSSGDPHMNGQRLSTLLGSILRIDVSTLDTDDEYSIPPDNPFVGLENARQEIWAYGLRNPWRFNFDTETGKLWAGDVGQNKSEEVNLIEPGVNYGWNIMEGNNCFRDKQCTHSNLRLPIKEYSHKDGCSIIGGYVYRGTRIPSLQGTYVYGDYCSGKIWGLKHEDNQVTEHMLLFDLDTRISAFGQDANGELYILSFDSNIYTFVQR